MTLWPATAVAVAAYGLEQATLGFPEAPLDPSGWAQLMATIRHERIPGLLMMAILDGALLVTPDQAQEAADAHRASMVAALTLEATLVATALLFDEADLEYRVLKGSAVAHLDFPDPALRSFGDIDLLVRSSQFDEAVEALVAVGHKRRYPEPRPGFDRRFGKGSCLVSRAGLEIDLHRSLAMGPYGVQMRVDDLWQRSSNFELAGHEFHALGPEERFLHACFHTALGDRRPRLASLRDVAQMHLARPLDIDFVRALSCSWRAEAVVARAVRMAADALGLDTDGPLTRWAVGFSPDRRDRRFLAVYTGADASYARKSFAAVWAIRGIRDKARFVFTLAVPDRRYLEQRRERRMGRWLRGLAQVRRARRTR